MPAIEIQLLGNGNAGYVLAGIDEENALQAAIGCYIVLGKVLQKLTE